MIKGMQMFNLDKILRRSLSSDVAKMKEKYEYFINIDNGMDFLHVYLTKKELKRLLKKDEFGNESLNIPDKKIQKLWNEYYDKQDKKRQENIKNISLDDIPKVSDMEYIYFSEFLTVDEWMKVVNCEAVLEMTEDGQVEIRPVIVLENYEIERLINRTDISDDFIYEVKFNDDKFTPLTFRELKIHAKAMAKRLIIDKEHTDNFLQFLTIEELEQIKNKEIALYQTVDKFLLVSVYD